jgi:hypothetical protein
VRLWRCPRRREADRRGDEEDVGAAAIEAQCSELASAPGCMLAIGGGRRSRIHVYDSLRCRAPPR